VLNAPKKIGSVLITVTGQFRNAAVTLEHFTLRIRDVAGAPITILDEEFFLNVPFATVSGSSGNGYERSISMRANYLLPAAGNRSYDVQIAVDPTGGAGVGFNNVIVSVDGVY
jgi:hypothetical protein